MHNKNTGLTNNISSVKKLLEKEKKRQEVFTAIADAFVDISSNCKDMLAFSSRKLAELTNDLSLICLISDNGKNIDTTASYHLDDKLRNEFGNLLNAFPINLNEGIFRQVIETGLPLNIPVKGNKLNIPGLSSEFNKFFVKYSLSGILTLPIHINNKVIGTLSLFRIGSAFPFRTDEQTFLQSIANLLASIIRNSRLYKEKEFLLREMHHRIKNNLQVISSLLSIQSDYVKDEESHKLFFNSLNRIRSMSMIYENPYQASDFSGVAFDKYLNDLVTYLYRTYNINTNLVKLNINIGPVYLPIDASVTCGLIINELISNAFKHAFPDGRSGNIKLSFVKSVKQIKLVVSDDGIGLPENMDIEINDTFGLLLISTLVDQLNGTLEVIRTNGTKFIIRFPHNYN
jgi:two-component sensor histidine kinase